MRIYEPIYDRNTLGLPGYGTHYIVLAHELNLLERPPIVGDTQHADFRWMSPWEIVSSRKAHPNILIQNGIVPHADVIICNSFGGADKAGRSLF